MLFAKVDQTESQRLRAFHWRPSDRTLRLWSLEKVGERRCEYDATIVEPRAYRQPAVFGRDAKYA